MQVKKYIDYQEVIFLEDHEDIVAVAEEVLSDAAREDQEHGEIGAHEVSCHFEQGGKIYYANAFPFWNRHDKTYYYFDGLSNVNVSLEANPVFSDAPSVKGEPHPNAEMICNWINGHVLEWNNGLDDRWFEFPYSNTAEKATGAYALLHNVENGMMYRLKR